MVDHRVHVAEIPLEMVLVTNRGGAGGFLNEIDYPRGCSNGIGCSELQLHLAWHVDQVSLDGPVPDFAQRLVEIGTRRAERGFGFAERRLNGDAVAQRCRQVRRRLSIGKFQEIVNRRARFRAAVWPAPISPSML